MRYTSENEFSKSIKGGATGLILLCGEENYLIANWSKAVLQQFGSEESFNLQFLDGITPNLDELFDATQQLPLFADNKCVYLADLDPSKLNADDQKKLEEILIQLPPECTLLITSRAPHFNAKNAGSKKIIALADKYGGVLELNGRDKTSMARFLQSQAKEAGSELSSELARYLLEICENDMQSLLGEVKKIATYAGQEPITREQIDAIASRKTEAKVFDLSKAITAGNAQRAMELVRDLLYMREAPVAITATLIMSYVDMYRAQVGKSAGASAEEVAGRFHYKGREFRIRNAYRVHTSVQALRQALNLLFQCERQLKGSSLDSDFVLEKTVLALLACREG